MLVYRNDSNYLWFGNCFIPFVRFWGIFTAIVICGVGVDIFIRHRLMGIYIIITSFIVLFLEIMWAITLFLKVCVHDANNKIFHVWNIILKIKLWKKSIIYSALSVALLLKPYNLWLSSVAGAMLLTLAFFHLILTFQTPKKDKGTESLLRNEDFSHDRHEEVIFEILDNTIKPKEEVSVEEPAGNVLEI